MTRVKHLPDPFLIANSMEICYNDSIMTTEWREPK